MVRRGFANEPSDQLKTRRSSWVRQRLALAVALDEWRAQVLGKALLPEGRHRPTLPLDEVAGSRCLERCAARQRPIDYREASEHDHAFASGIAAQDIQRPAVQLHQTQLPNEPKSRSRVNTSNEMLSFFAKTARLSQNGRSPPLYKSTTRRCGPSECSSTLPRP